MEKNIAQKDKHIAILMKEKERIFNNDKDQTKKPNNYSGNNCKAY